MSPEFVIAIDGPAGAGKSTVARKVAGRLDGFRYLDTGAMYRAVTAYLLRHGGLHASPEEMAAAAEGLEWRFERLFVHGEEVTGAIRSPEVTAEVSRISAVSEVRRVMRRKQREFPGKLVAEGRDMGSVVYPNAQVKVYLDATLGERARRRYRQYPDLGVEEYRERIARRDAQDSGREDSPLVQAPEAIEIDTSRLTVEEVVDKIVALALERLDQGGGSA